MFADLSGYVPNQLLVQIKEGVSREEMQTLFAENGAFVVAYYDDTKIFHLQLHPGRDAKESAVIFKGLPGVKGVRTITTEEVVKAEMVDTTVTPPTDLASFISSPTALIGGAAVLIYFMSKRRRRRL